MTYERFQTTRWTEIRALAGGDEADRRRVIEILVTRYWPPVYAHLRDQGRSSNDAADLTQEFFTQVVLGRGLFDHAQQDRGKLRTLMLTALKNFAVDQHRRQSSRGGGVTIPLESIQIEESRRLASEEADLPFSFGHRWAIAVLDEAIRRCETHYREGDRERHWIIFEGWVLNPARSQNQPDDFAELARTAGFTSTPQAASALQVVKQRMQALIREVVGETVADGEDIDAELADVKRYMTL